MTTFHYEHASKYGQPTKYLNGGILQTQDPIHDVLQKCVNNNTIIIDT